METLTESWKVPFYLCICAPKPLQDNKRRLKSSFIVCSPNNIIHQRTISILSRFTIPFLFQWNLNICQQCRGSDRVCKGRWQWCGWPWYSGRELQNTAAEEKTTPKDKTTGERRRTKTTNMSAESDSKVLIIQHFDAGHKYNLLLNILPIFHDLRMSVRTLTNRLKEAGISDAVIRDNCLARKKFPT